MATRWSKKALEAVVLGFASLMLLYFGYAEYSEKPELNGSNYLALGVIGALGVVQSLTSGDKAASDWLRAAFFSLFSLFIGLDFVGEVQKGTVVQWILLATVSLILVIGVIDMVRRRFPRPSGPSASGEN